MKINRTTGGILFNNFEKKQGCIGVRYYTKRQVNDVTYDDFIADIRKKITWLTEKGICDKKIATLGDYSYNWLVSTYSIMCAGEIVIPLDKELLAEDLSKLLFLADAEYLFYDRKFEEKAQQIHEITGIPILCYNEEAHLTEVCNCDEEKAIFCDDENKVAMFLFTSGTTGQNKVVMITHKNLYGNACNSYHKNYEEIQKILLAVPLCHAFGLCALVITLFGGHAVCLNEDIRYVTRNFNLFEPTVIYTVPMIAESFYNYIQNTRDSENDIKLKVIVSAGAPLDPQITYRYEKIGVCVLQAYGLTESLIVSCNSFEWNKAESVGRTEKLSNIKFVDGEIWISGDSICAGYYRNEIENKKTFIDGWFRTGDTGRIDEDGFLYITGRIKNLIIRDDGNNISPEELEQRIAAAMPYTQEVIVKLVNKKITVEIYCGEDPDEDTVKKIHFDIESINDELPAYKMIENIIIRDIPFEKTNLGKIKRGQKNV